MSYHHLKHRIDSKIQNAFDIKGLTFEYAQWLSIRLFIVLYISTNVSGGKRNQTKQLFLDCSLKFRIWCDMIKDANDYKVHGMSYHVFILIISTIINNDKKTQQNFSISTSSFKSKALMDMLKYLKIATLFLLKFAPL